MVKPLATWRIAAGLVLAISIGQSHGASFDCAKAQTKVEKFVCGNDAISKLDDELGSVYRDVLSKAEGSRKERLIKQQKHWIARTRNACVSETCFKHAYWSRLAELETFFEPKSPLYEKESDKAVAIKQVLATSRLYEATLSDPQLCRQIFQDLKEMKNIRFVDSVVQVESYEDPALDPWKRRCKNGRPLNFDYACERNLTPDDKDGELMGCRAGYGLPPFKLFDLPPLSDSSKHHYVFYSDDAYGPMNRDSRGPSLGGGFAGFHEINFEHCDELVKDGFAQAWPSRRERPNYNSVLAYRQQYYLLILERQFGSYWLSLKPLGRNRICQWAPVESATPKPRKE